MAPMDIGRSAETVRGAPIQFDGLGTVRQPHFYEFSNALRYSYRASPLNLCSGRFVAFVCDDGVPIVII